MTFGFIEAEKASFPINRTYRVPEVRQSGFFAWQERPACRHQQQDMVYLAHMRTAFALSNGACGSSRMHRDLVDEGHEIGRHRTTQLMRQNQLIARQKRRFKRTTHSEQAWPVAPSLVALDFAADGPDRKCGSRHLLHLDSGGLALPRGRAGSLLPARRRLGHE
jgi:putative transposase